MRDSTTEDEVIREVKQVIKLTGLHIQRINTGAFRVDSRYVRTCDKGTLDFEGFDNHGRFVGIECKRPKGGRLSPEQKDRIEAINRFGGVAGVVTSGKEAYELLKSNECL